MARKSHIPEAVLAAMKANDRHGWTLEDLQVELARRGMPTDFSSIFRAAGRLTTEGSIRKLMLDDGRARFELAGSHHDHLHCIRCDALVPTPCVIPPRVFAILESRTGASIDDHSIIFSGTCRSCRQKRRRSRRRA